MQGGRSCPASRDPSSWGWGMGPMAQGSRFCPGPEAIRRPEGQPGLHPPPAPGKLGHRQSPGSPGLSGQLGETGRAPKIQAICTQWSLGSKGLASPAVEGGFPMGVISSLQRLPFLSTQGLGASVDTCAQEGGEEWPSGDRSAHWQPSPCPAHAGAGGRQPLGLWARPPRSREQAAGLARQFPAHEAALSGAV